MDMQEMNQSDVIHQMVQEQIQREIQMYYSGWVSLFLKLFEPQELESCIEKINAIEKQQRMPQELRVDILFIREQFISEDLHPSHLLLALIRQSLLPLFAKDLSTTPKESYFPAEAFEKVGFLYASLKKDHEYGVTRKYWRGYFQDIPSLKTIPSWKSELIQPDLEVYHERQMAIEDEEEVEKTFSEDEKNFIEQSYHQPEKALTTVCQQLARYCDWSLSYVESLLSTYNMHPQLLFEPLRQKIYMNTGIDVLLLDFAIVCLEQEWNRLGLELFNEWIQADQEKLFYFELPFLQRSNNHFRESSLINRIVFSGKQIFHQEKIEYLDPVLKSMLIAHIQKIHSSEALKKESLEYLIRWIPDFFKNQTDIVQLRAVGHYIDPWLYHIYPQLIEMLKDALKRNDLDHAEFYWDLVPRSWRYSDRVAIAKSAREFCAGIQDGFLKIFSHQEMNYTALAENYYFDWCREDRQLYCMDCIDRNDYEFIDTCLKPPVQFDLMESMIDNERGRAQKFFDHLIQQPDGHVFLHDRTQCIVQASPVARIEFYWNQTCWSHEERNAIRPYFHDDIGSVSDHEYIILTEQPVELESVLTNSSAQRVQELGKDILDDLSDMLEECYSSAQINPLLFSKYDEESSISALTPRNL